MQQLAFYFHILTTMHGQNHFKSVKIIPLRTAFVNPNCNEIIKSH